MHPEMYGSLPGWEVLAAPCSIQGESSQPWLIYIEGSSWSDYRIAQKHLELLY